MRRLGKSIVSTAKGRYKNKNFEIYSQSSTDPKAAELMFRVGSNKYKSPVTEIGTSTVTEYVELELVPGRSLLYTP